MIIATVSPKFQVVIPKEVRETLEIEAGMKITIFSYGKRIEMMPVESLDSTFGIAKGINTTIEREPDRNL